MDGGVSVSNAAVSVMERAARSPLPPFHKWLTASATTRRTTTTTKGAAAAATAAHPLFIAPVLSYLLLKVPGASAARMAARLRLFVVCRGALPHVVVVVVVSMPLMLQVALALRTGAPARHPPLRAAA